MAKTRKSSATLNNFGPGAQALFHVLLGLFALLCIVPFIFVIIISFTSEESIRQIGVRSCTREEYGLAGALRSIPENVALRVGEKPCYLTCDLDVLDPSVLPGTGTPEPGGITFQELASTLVSLVTRLNVVGIDVVELAPNLDPTGVSAVVAAKVVRECLIALGRGPGSRGEVL